MFIFTFFVLLFLKSFFHKILSNTNNYKTDLFDPQIELYPVLPLQVRVYLGVIAMNWHSTLPRFPELVSQDQMHFIVVPLTPLFRGESLNTLQGNTDSVSEAHPLDRKNMSIFAPAMGK